MDLETMEIPVAELMAKPGGGRQPTERDLALDALVLRVMDNADTAIGWRYAPEKKLTARAAAVRSIKRTGLVGKVFVSARGDQLFFSQKQLDSRGRRKAK
jgi:hypothetical protein